MNTEKSSDVLEIRRQKVEQLKKEKIHLFPNDFKTTHSVGEIRALIEQDPDSLTGDSPVFAIAGRLMAINRFGKSAFVRLRDRSGQIQAYLRKDLLGEESYALFRQLDIGDFIGLNGGMFQTKTGEWTLLAKEMTLLSKSVRPLPEKYHGLRDPEKRYRRRYLDLIMNPEVREIFVKRSRIIQAIRHFLLQRDFLEVETPMMQPIPGGAEAEPFVTHHNALGMDLYLRIAPELYLKRLVVGGFERVFEINRNFRNEGISTQHNPEFTMLEFYQAYAAFEDLMALTEEMLAETARQVAGSSAITYQGQTIEMAGPWRRMALTEALEQIGGIDASALGDKEALLQIAADRNIQVTKTSRLGKIVTKLFDALV
ncbi:MAG: lysine--tRNA ligase, partial [Desulfobacterales bacterium]|nr:lysine--tRNA ligase [Desulfobacterales bacterium]